MPMAKALLLTKADQESEVRSSITQVELSELAPGEVLVAVDYSSLNYKDALVMRGMGKLVKTYPHVPGIDLAGTVVESRDGRFTIGEKVLQTGFFLGERFWGGYAELCNCRGEHLVKIPAELSCKDAMVMGTAGFTAMQAIMQMEHNGLAPGQGPVMVLGATGGVGSISCALLAARGYDVHGSTGKVDQHEWLRSLGVQEVVERKKHEVEHPRLLDKAMYAGCIDCVGGQSLACVLPKMLYRSSVACLGNAGGNVLNTTVLPFLLRGINILGIDSVQCPRGLRDEIWNRLAQDLPVSAYGALGTVVGLEKLEMLAEAILDGGVRGRILVSPSQ